MSCLLSNKFYYNISNDIIQKYKGQHTIHKHILYDITINKFINISNKTNEFILKYNNIINKNLNIHQNIYKYIYNDSNYNMNNNILTNKINKLFIFKIMSILKLYEVNKLIDYNNYENIYKIILHYFKNDKSYLGKLFIHLKPSKIDSKY